MSVLLISYSAIIPRSDRFPAEVNLLVIPAFALLIFALASQDKVLLNAGIFARSDTLIRLGNESFALYLCHAPLLGIFGYTLWLNHSTNSSATGGEIYSSIFVLAAFSLGKIFHMNFEKPMEKRFLIYSKVRDK